MSTTFGPRRAVFLPRPQEPEPTPAGPALRELETLDRLYRALCSILYNYAPTSGHPGGSISSGRIVAGLLFATMDYDVGDPDRLDADVISYAAGHKALGLYAMWALRDEIARQTAPELLPADDRRRLRLEDLLGFRRNPITATPLFRRFGSKALDGHPTPATPFVRLATGASGVGFAGSLGLALGAADLFGFASPKFHIVEGEGGLTPGRVAEALAFAGTASLHNVIVHVDWNQASIDSDHVTREGSASGDYVQWDPMELFHLHDWNVLYVEDGTDFGEILRAQRQALSLGNAQPTAIVYRTVKGWRYGIEGRSSHGAGHPLCSAGFYDSLTPLLGERAATVPRCAAGHTRCADGSDRAQVEDCYWQSLLLIRDAIEANPVAAAALAQRLRFAKRRLDAHGRRPREGAPRIDNVYETVFSGSAPDDLTPQPGSSTTLRAQLGRVLGRLNASSGGALLVGSADLLGSTSLSEATRGFPGGYFNTARNPGSRTLAVGGIAEDAMSAILSGTSMYGAHIGVGSSYAAFLAPLGHIAARLHAIGAQARAAVDGTAYRPFILVCGHAGLKTGEDGPTHADPQSLQLLQENFPPGTMITLTPWEPAEMWPLMVAALARRPAIIAPFVTRPSESVPDRSRLGLAPAGASTTGVYLLRPARGDNACPVVLQGSEVAVAFVRDALPRLDEEGLDVAVYYIASVELFDLLSEEQRRRIYPESVAQEAMAITGFTLPTIYRWIRSDHGRRHSLHPYRAGHFLGSGPGDVVVAEAGLDGEAQVAAIRGYIEERRRLRR